MGLFGSDNVKGDIKELVGDSALIKKASRNEQKSISHILEIIEKDFKEVHKTIANHPESAFIEVNAPSTLATITSRLTKSYELWSDISLLERSESENLKKIGSFAKRISSLILELKKELLEPVAINRIDPVQHRKAGVLQKYENLLRMINDELNPIFQKELQIEKAIQNA